MDPPVSEKQAPTQNKTLLSNTDLTRAILKGYNIPPGSINYGQFGFGLNGLPSRFEATNNQLGKIKL